MKYKEDENTLIYKVRNKEGKIEEVLKDELDISGRLFRKLYKKNSILYNGKKAGRNKKVTKDGIITIFMEDEEHRYELEDMNLNIIYEDYDLIIVNKVPGIVVHPTKGHDSGTLANGIAYYFKEKNIKKKIRFVNRLDMDTSGVIMIAKNSFGHQQMSKQFEEDTVTKKYLVLVEGIIEKEIGEINKPIGKDPKDNIRNIVLENGKPSHTKYKVVEKYKNVTLLEVEIITGRTHQIRVHMNYIGHPVIGDVFYNDPSQLIDRQALHSYSMSFNVPRTGDRIKVKADMPEDMIKAIETLK